MQWSLESLEKHLLVGSTLVEGSTLSEGEAEAVLAGRTVSGHPAHELRELLNYRASVGWLMREVAAVPFLSTDLLLGFHQRLFAGFEVPGGRFKTNRNFTFRSDGTKHFYLSPQETPEAVRLWVEAFNAKPTTSAAEGSARLYADFESIHPFDDGNGRIGRLLMSYWLHWKFAKLFVFYAKDQLDHLQAIEATNSGDFGRLIRFFEERLRNEGA